MTGEEQGWSGEDGQSMAGILGHGIVWLWVQLYSLWHETSLRGSGQWPGVQSMTGTGTTRMTRASMPCHVLVTCALSDVVVATLRRQLMAVLGLTRKHILHALIRCTTK